LTVAHFVWCKYNHRGGAFGLKKFFETHVAWDRDCYRGWTIAGIGRIESRGRITIANDMTVKGGTYYPMTVKAHLRA
jgi:acetyl-CoA carboxylase carboxyltransferase component